MTMNDALLRIIGEHEKKFGGRIGFYAENFTTGNTLAYKEGETFGTASVIKVPLLIAYFKKCQEGVFDFSAVIAQKNKYLCDIPEEVGLMKKIPRETLIPIETIAMLMIFLSDNTAMNVFLTDFVPKDLFNRMMVDMGYASTRLAVEKLDSSVFFGSKGDIGYSTPWELAKILRDAMRYASIEQRYADILIEYMGMNHLSLRLTRGLPHRTRFGDAALIEKYGSKAGTYTRIKVINDLAFAVTAKGESIIISCMMNGLADENGVRPSAVDSMQNKLFGIIGDMAFQSLA